MKQKWEHFYYAPHQFSHEHIADDIRKLGEDGWEMVNFVIREEEDGVDYAFWGGVPKAVEIVVAFG